METLNWQLGSGVISITLGELDNALKSLREGLAIGIESEDRYSIACANEGMGEFYASISEFDIANNYYRKAIANHKLVGENIRSRQRQKKLEAFI